MGPFYINKATRFSQYSSTYTRSHDYTNISWTKSLSIIQCHNNNITGNDNITGNRKLTNMVTRTLM